MLYYIIFIFYIEVNRTKANNKYTFVWKKAVTENQIKLGIKISEFVAECESLYDIKIIHGNTIQIRHLKKLRKKLHAIKEAEDVEFVHGIGKRKSPIQKSMERLEEYIARLKGYTNKIHICGKRNSYSKTDHDATFMRMKEDAMGNGRLKIFQSLKRQPLLRNVLPSSQRVYHIMRYVHMVDFVQ